MFFYILLVIGLLIAAVLIRALTKPDMVRYQRSTWINAGPERIIPHIANFHNWKDWSPWEKMGEMERTYGGPTEGVGAKYGWKSNGRAGEGSMEVLQSSVSGVKIDLQFVKPFKNVCVANFEFTSEWGGTTVNWVMDGPNLFMGKVMSVFLDMEKMIGKDFDLGLAGLKRVVEEANGKAGS
ncbi:MAG: SRPBCC family protein [Flavobacteriales bacterium]|nr:SRPBCC family protein [Flavobacteriales bacterium]